MRSVRSLSWATKRATKNLNTCANGGEEGRHIYFCDVEDGEASAIMSALLALGDVEEEVDGLLIDENAQAVMIDADMRAFLAMEQFEGVVIPIVGGTLPLRVVEMCCASVFGDCSSALARCVKRKLLLARLEACREVVSAAVPEKAAAAEKAESKKAAAAEKAAAKKAAEREYLAAAAEKAAAKKAAAAAKKAAVVGPDPARAPTEPSSRFWGVSWNKQNRRWKAEYTDANRKKRYIGLYDTQEAAAHAVNAAIRRAGLEGKRRMNAVVDGQLVPKPPRKPSSRKRRREESAAATPSQRARRDAEQSTDAAMEC